MITVNIKGKKEISLGKLSTVLATYLFSLYSVTYNLLDPQNSSYPTQLFQ